MGSCVTWRLFNQRPWWRYALYCAPSWLRIERVWLRYDAQKWQDEYLTWEPLKYKGIERLNMAAGTTDARIWTPDIKMLNT